jgi:hypothetical protein
MFPPKWLAFFRLDDLNDDRLEFPNATKALLSADAADPNGSNNDNAMIPRNMARPPISMSLIMSHGCGANQVRWMELRTYRGPHLIAGRRHDAGEACERERGGRALSPVFGLI